MRNGCGALPILERKVAEVAELSCVFIAGQIAAAAPKLVDLSPVFDVEWLGRAVAGALVRECTAPASCLPFSAAGRQGRCHRASGNRPRNNRQACAARALPIRAKWLSS